MKTATSSITHSELCIATAKRFIDKVALYEYKSFASKEEPDVLVFGIGTTALYEIKLFMSDFNADRKKECRKIWRVPLWARTIGKNAEHYSSFAHNISIKEVKNGNRKIRLEIYREKPEVTLVEREHLGKQRFFVCPYGLIPIEKLPEGWGLYYYKGGKFYLKRGSFNFRSDLHIENDLLVHALRRYASGDNTGILINTYGNKEGKENEKI